MTINLKNRHFLTLADFTPVEIEFLLTLALDLKRANYAGAEQPGLKGKKIALIFEKASTRTRCAFEVAAFDQGAHVTYIESSSSHVGVKESMRDTARVLGRMYNGIEYRGFDQKNIEELAAYAGVPVWNGLTDQHHPTQILADLLTIQEHSMRNLKDVKLCYLGDCNNNTANSLMLGAAKMGLDFRMAGPEKLHPQQELINSCREINEETQGKIVITEDIAIAVADVDFLYTDVWLSMGEPDSEWTERIKLLHPYQVNQKVLDMTHNPRVKFMHCLPAHHNRQTEIGERIFKNFGLEAMEVTEDVFESTHSIVFDQAENRLHTIKAVLVATL